MHQPHRSATADDPSVKTVENRGDFGSHHQNRQARLTAGSGATR